ncbi:10989_t:CDS:2 [Funneliformis geosporum]|uniref:10989_t:CDS:1 n=1 Tax=Funneliformis geosporum TaxID=1117311 RepID=A0A9W4SS02_9GLOM|nr:10989_t:CDS:2 [Funneliformis geosporum]
MPEEKHSLSYPIENVPVFKRDHDDHVEGDGHNDHDDKHGSTGYGGSSAASLSIQWSLMAVAATFLTTLIGF